MLMTCKFYCGRLVDIGFSDADSCRDIPTKNVYNIILVRKGALTLQVNGRRVRGFAPCVFLLKEGLDVSFVSSQKLAAQSIHFDVGFLYRSVTFETVNSGQYEGLMGKLGLVPLRAFYDFSSDFSYVLPLSEEACAQVSGFFGNFCGAVSNLSYYRWSCLARQNLNGLLEMVHQLYVDFINPDKREFSKKVPEIWVQALLRIIHTHYPDGGRLSLVPLSKEIGINKDTVAKKFRELVGCSVGEYIIDYRLKCACHSLANTGGTLKEIAAQCGFGNQAYFIRQFEKRKGMTPTQFRKNALASRREVLGVPILE